MRRTDCTPHFWSSRWSQSASACPLCLSPLCSVALLVAQIDILSVCLLYHQASNANGPTTGTTSSAPHWCALSMGKWERIWPKSTARNESTCCECQVQANTQIRTQTHTQTVLDASFSGPHVGTHDEFSLPALPTYLPALKCIQFTCHGSFGSQHCEALGTVCFVRLCLLLLMDGNEARTIGYFFGLFLLGLKPLRSVRP